jgi:hypothetical protein
LIREQVRPFAVCNAVVVLVADIHIPPIFPSFSVVS